MHLPTVKRYLGQGFSMWNVTSATVNHKLVAEYDLIDVTVVMFYVTDLTFHVRKPVPVTFPLIVAKSLLSSVVKWRGGIYYI